MLGLRRIAELLPPEQPAYGLFVPDDGPLGYGPSSDELTVAAMAGDVVNRIRAVAPSGPVVLAGHSAGGLIALEAARKILAAGDGEPRLLLMDTARPYGAIDYYWGESIMLWRQLPGIAAERLLAAVTKPFRRAAPAGSQPGAGHPDDLITQHARSLESVIAAQKRYRVRPYPGEVAVMRTRQGLLIAKGRRTLGWRTVTRGRPDVIPVPGSHMGMLRPPQVQVVARRMAAWLSATRPDRGCAPGPAVPDGAADRAPAGRS